jgi:hypothetical protein
MNTGILKTSPDKRLTARGNHLLRQIIVGQVGVIRQISSNWSEEMGFGRWLRNNRVETGSIEQDFGSYTAEKSAGQAVLCIQDTSVISFGNLGRHQGLGMTQGGGRGFMVHPTLVLNAQTGSCIGLSGIEHYRYPVEGEGQEAEKGPTKERHQINIEEKKTYTWIKSGIKSRERLSNARQIIHLMDREGDFYELFIEFAAHRKENEFLLTRAHHDRLIRLPKSDGHRQFTKQGKSQDKLYALLGRTLSKGVLQVELPATHQQKGRSTQIEVRWQENVEIRRPKNAGRTYKGERLPTVVRVNVIEFTEITPLEGQEARNWLFITSLPINTMADALAIFKWYKWRWWIEMNFSALKSRGLDLEHSLIETYLPLLKFAYLLSMAATIILQLIQARDGQIDQDMDTVFSQEEQHIIKSINPTLEGNTEKLKNPHPHNSLAFAAWVIARLGGWKGYKTQRPPGIQTMSRGLAKFYILAQSQWNSSA